ncbi:Homocitrate synthase [Metarhizium brunneum]|uniref:Homocitrate synthase n=1 Tax=Metarhizium brunneum TaxID=500148 RepID=A0A7D5V2J8_9HYPO
MARMMVGSRDYVMSRYKLHKIKEIEGMVADAVQIVSEYLGNGQTTLRALAPALVSVPTTVPDGRLAEWRRHNIPFNNPITGTLYMPLHLTLSKTNLSVSPLKEVLMFLAMLGFCAFSHKAGIHAKAILANPSTYEILSPEDYGLSRYVHFASRLTGWNAIKSRVEQLGLSMSDE